MPVQMEKYRPVTLQIDSLNFNVFSADEIRKFSVCRVVNTVSFDSLGNPTTGKNIFINFMIKNLIKSF